MEKTKLHLVGWLLFVFLGLIELRFLISDSYAPPRSLDVLVILVAVGFLLAAKEIDKLRSRLAQLEDQSGEKEKGNK